MHLLRIEDEIANNFDGENAYKYQMLRVMEDHRGNVMFLLIMRRHFTICTMLYTQTLLSTILWNEQCRSLPHLMFNLRERGDFFNMCCFDAKNHGLRTYIQRPTILHNLHI